MSVAQITSLSVIEIFANYGIKQFANFGGIQYLGMGIAGYIGVIIMLIISLQGSTLLMVNNAWDGINALLTSLFAFFVLGERLKHWSQYIGLFMITIGIYILKVPIINNNVFKWPSM
jgi:multidrug transporter EmrE-like cation transporter